MESRSAKHETADMFLYDALHYVLTPSIPACISNVQQLVVIAALHCASFMSNRWQLMCMLVNESNLAVALRHSYKTMREKSELQACLFTNMSACSKINSSGISLT